MSIKGNFEGQRGGHLRRKIESLKSDASLGCQLEGILAMRTSFDVEPPFVGNRGVIRALNEALDERDELREFKRADNSEFLRNENRRLIGERNKAEHLLKELRDQFDVEPMEECECGEEMFAFEEWCVECKAEIARQLENGEGEWLSDGCAECGEELADNEPEFCFTCDANNETLILDEENAQALSDAWAESEADETISSAEHCSYCGIHCPRYQTNGICDACFLNGADRETMVRAECGHDAGVECSACGEEMGQAEEPRKIGGTSDPLAVKIQAAALRGQLATSLEPGHDSIMVGVGKMLYNMFMGNRPDDPTRLDHLILKEDPAANTHAESEFVEFLAEAEPVRFGDVKDQVVLSGYMKNRKSKAERDALAICHTQGCKKPTDDCERFYCSTCWDYSK